MKTYKIIIDTNIIVSALKSRNGFSFDLLSIIDDKRFKVYISVPLIFEYEDAVKRNKSKIKLNKSDIDAIIDYICLIAEKRKIFYLWRPYLKDPKDDMILEVAVESEADYIISFNKKDFVGVEKFNIKVVTPKEFLKIIGEI
ncbi:MAG: putative toxin-antitoxin system toxin component, PIN family [Ignavibacteria bacterium GWB2_35_6b]|nr:MAG: putative toxin-antitoxin system toxin component, PIN family [Ignavibacteria bacterium GWB2_35_6b]